jgi:hypothetical protein
MRLLDKNNYESVQKALQQVTINNLFARSAFPVHLKFTF